MERVEELVDQKIEKYVKDKTLAELKGLGDALDVLVLPLSSRQ
ncbi:hypothetical protein OCB14_27085 [Bacillus cereus]|nr:hypothetical protein [Bacillus cereus]MCU5545275.1 hypothetical protein [Bacillus cereus]